MYFYQPTSEATKPNATSGNHLAKATPEPTEKQLTLKNKQEESTDTSVVYHDKNVHIEDHGEAFTFSLDLPGIRSSDAKVELRDGVLTVEAERKFADKRTTKHIQHFVIKEQPIDIDQLRASLSDGVLTITVPKKPDAKPIDIPVATEYPPEKTEDVKELRLALDLPGVRASDLRLEFRDGTITLHAERKDRASCIDKIFYVDQARVDPESFKAFMIDGVLTITGYSKDAPEPKQIGVSSGPARGPKQITVSDLTAAAATTNDHVETKKADDVVVETVTDEK